MRIVKLAVHDFRTFPGTFELPLKDGCNLLLHGENGAGKSSLAAALREFLSMEQPFPRPLDPFVHVFSAQPNAAGVVPPPAARVKLHFDTANPPEVMAWSPGHRHGESLPINGGSFRSLTRVRPNQTPVNGASEEIELLRGGAVVSSLSSAFGRGLREARLTAMLGYLVALQPDQFCFAFGSSGKALSVSLETHHLLDQSDILVTTTDGVGVIEAKVGSHDPFDQALKYPARWRMLLTEHLPTNAGRFPTTPAIQ